MEDMVWMYGSIQGGILGKRNTLEGRDSKSSEDNYR